MSLWFAVEVRFLHGRYHGRGEDNRSEWPPSPLRLFQAIVAAALNGRWAVEDHGTTKVALRWLEGLGAPERVLAVSARSLRPYRLAVPNNQADHHLPALRTGQRLEPLLAKEKELKDVRPTWVGAAPLVYLWRIPNEARSEAERVVPVVRRLVVLGTGLDHAVADARISVEEPCFTTLRDQVIGLAACPGTLDSLVERHAAFRHRLEGGGLRESMPPVRYAPSRPPAHGPTVLLLHLRARSESGTEGFCPVEPQHAALLSQAVRDALAERLTTALTARGCPNSLQPSDVARLVIGRGAGPEDAFVRLRFAPSPSTFPDGLIRRLLVVVPATFPLAPDVIRRALDGLSVRVRLTPAIVVECTLASADLSEATEQAMLARFKGPARIWRSVSPVLLSRTGAPFETSLRTALEQAGYADCTSYELRRTPYFPRQPRADAAWSLPRAPGGARWLADRRSSHAEIAFAAPVAGPLLVGDGRFLGLGLFQAVREEPPGFAEVALYRVPPRAALRVASTIRVADATRRALMSGGGNLAEFSGHDAEGPLRDDPAHGHAFYMPFDRDGDGVIDQVAVYARLGFSDSGRERIEGLRWIRVQGIRHEIELACFGSPEEVTATCPLFGRSRLWRSATPYYRPRHRKRGDRELTELDVTARQLAGEWGLRRPGDVVPAVAWLEKPTHGSAQRFDDVRKESDKWAADRRGAWLELNFPTEIVGPIALGRSAHFGLGVFRPESSNTSTV